MFIPLLNLPSIDVVEIDNITPRHTEMSAWLSTLPLANVEVSSMQVLEVLRRYNRCHMPPVLRFTMLDSISHVCNELTKALSSKYRDSVFPLSDRNRKRYNLVNQLLEEMACGFKRIAMDYYEQANNQKNVNATMVDATRIAIVYLSRRIVSAYAAYEHDANGLWLDLHQLYKIVEQYQSTDISTEHKEKLQANIRIVQHTYVRIVLLAITNPYHLMLGEAQLIYAYLNKWCTGVRIKHVSGYIGSEGDLVIDCNSDKAPYFVFSKSLSEPKDTRTVDMQQLIARFHSTVDALTTRKENGCEQNINTTFTERLRRDMILRLQTVWNGRFERKFVRKIKTAKIRIATGLSASHYVVDNGQEFFPESNEVQYYRPKDISAELSLVPDDYEPWKIDEQAHEVNAGIEQVRASNFNVRTDVWEKIYATQAHARTLRESSAIHYNAFIWDQLNVSDNGFGLLRDTSGDSHVTVGSVVAYQDESQKDCWLLGMIRWIRQYENNRFEMGVQFLDGTPQAVAVRAIAGAGCGSEYFRALVIENTIDQKTTSWIIVPAVVYDIGTKLALNTRTEITYIALTKLIRTTTGCSIFSYDFISTPEVEKENIKRMKSA